MTLTQVYKALSSFDCKKPAGPDQIEPYFLKSAADLIVRPTVSISNLSLSCRLIPRSWKSAFVLPLLKGGDLSSLDNYCPISRLSITATVLESLVKEQQSI